MSSRTIRLIERLGNQSVVILVDTRSSHNFLDPSIVKQLHSLDGRCVGAKLNVQGVTSFTDLFVLVLAGCDIVLGIQWLSTLGILIGT